MYLRSRMCLASSSQKLFFCTAMELLSSAWHAVRSLTPIGGRKRNRDDDMNEVHTSTARAETARTLLVSAAWAGNGSKKFKWNEHPVPRSTFGPKPIEWRDTPGFFMGSAPRGDSSLNHNEATGAAWRKPAGNVGVEGSCAVDGVKTAAARAGPSSGVNRGLAPGLAPGRQPSLTGSNPQPALRARLGGHRSRGSVQRGQHDKKKDVSHADFYGRFWGRMESIIRKQEPSLANVTEPISLYRFHHDKVMKLTNRANLLYSSDIAERRQNELKEIESSISRIRTMRLQPKRANVYPYKRRLVLPEITDAKRAELLELTCKPSGEPVLRHEASKVKLTGGDLQRLAPGNWLNDETINLYMRLLQDRDTKIHRREDAAKFPKCHFFTTFFLPKLYKDSGAYDYNGVRRWTMPARLKAIGQSRSSILDVDKIIVPVNQGGIHWTVAVIDLQKKRFEYFDSLGGEDHECLDSLAQYLRDEFQNKRAEDRPDILDWARVFPKNIPQQRNGIDCGVFLSMFASHLAVEAELAEMDMNVYRFVMLDQFRKMETAAEFE